MDIFKLAVAITLAHVEANYRPLTEGEESLLEWAIKKDVEVRDVSPSLEEHYQE